MKEAAQLWFRQALRCLIAIGLLALAAGAAAQQAFPSRPITILFPYPAGSTDSTLLRLVAADVSSRLGQGIVVEHRPGANGHLGVLAQMNAKGDAHLLSYAGNSVLALDPLREANFRIQAGRDYTPIISLWTGPFMIVVNPKSPYRDLKGFVAYAKANPGKINLGLSSLGGVVHIAVQALAEQQGFEYLPITYKGTAPLLQALVAGDVHIGLATPGFIPMVQSGKLVAIATTTTQRMPKLPDVPTAAEAGFPVISNYTFWSGIVAPAEIGADATGKLNAAFNAALKTPEVVKNITELTYFVGGGSPDELANQVKSEMARMGPVIAKMKLE